jgi:hypothetical protein
MTRTVLAHARVALIVGCVLFLSSAAFAQSGISGTVRDVSGAVLPGVTVEASSPALIERVRAIVTDEGGRYNLVGLRPGVYQLSFSLPGFTSVVREGLELPANFIATVNMELRIGALEESITVRGDSPVVDVQSSARVSVMPREFIDALPTSRTYASDATLALGVMPNGQNVGGARASTQQRLLAHGMAAVNNTISVDGMKMNTNVGDGVTISQHNESMTQEVSTQVASAGADVSGGGLVLNLIPREGGNTFSGSNFVSYSGSSFQSDNLSADLIAQGLTTGDAVDYVYDFNPAIGGPIVRDKLWFFGSYRLGGNANFVPNTFFDDGSQAVNNQKVQNLTVRLTSQLTPRNKISAYIDRAFKDVPYSMNPGDDPETAARQQPGRLYYTSAIRWTSPVTNTLLVEAGMALVNNAYAFTYQPGVRQTRGTPAWYATAPRQDIVLQTLTTAFTRESFYDPPLTMLQSAMTYVTGSHSIKSGIQWRFGDSRTSWDGNGDLIQRYRAGIPDSVIVSNTPVRAFEQLNADLGFYVQDSWKISRLTVNPGVRFEYLNAGIQALGVEPGRFVGARSFPEMPNLPNWFDVAPRFGVAYDLTGDAKTALRGGINKYHEQITTGFAARYNPLNLSTDTRNWSDCDLIPGTSTCSGRNLPTNRDDIAQDNEIGPSNNALFGAAPTRRPDADIQREYTLEYSAGIDRELFSGVSVGATWYRRTWHDQAVQTNTLVSPSDYTAFQTPNPLTGEPITIYNLNPAKQGQVDLLDRTSTDDSKTSRTYTGFDVAGQWRHAGGTRVMGGWSAQQMVNVSCEVSDPNQLRFCDWSQYGIPFRHDFKAVGVTPVGLGIQVSAVFQSYGGVAPGCRGTTTGVCENGIAWAVPASAFPGGRRTQSVTVSLTEPGTLRLPRWNQLDLSVRRLFTFGRSRFDASLDLFNVTNANTVLDYNRNYGPTLYQPTQILQGRLLRLSSTLYF